MEILSRLSESKFRKSFKLSERDKSIILKIGIEGCRRDSYFFINERLKPAHPDNDGKQTPTKGHPVFVAQHATATCCRVCISKWHGIPQGIELNDSHINYISDLIVCWIAKADINPNSKSPSNSKQLSFF